MQNDTILMRTSGRFRGAFARIARARARAPRPDVFLAPRAAVGAGTPRGPAPNQGHPPAPGRCVAGPNRRAASDVPRAVVRRPRGPQRAPRAAHAPTDPCTCPPARPTSAPQHGRRSDLTSTRGASAAPASPCTSVARRRRVTQPQPASSNLRPRPASEHASVRTAQSAAACWRYAVGARDVHEPLTHAPIRPPSQHPGSPVSAEAPHRRPIGA